MSQIEQIPLNQIDIANSPQVRVCLSEEAIKEYKEAMELGADFPPIVVFKGDDGPAYLIADGHHRVKAARQAGLEAIAAEVHEGAIQDTTLRAVGANATHGLPRTKEDKEAAVRLLLSIKDWKD